MHFLSSACCCWFFFLLFVRKGCFSSSDLLFIRHFVLFQAFNLPEFERLFPHFDRNWTFRWTLFTTLTIFLSPCLFSAIGICCCGWGFFVFFFFPTFLSLEWGVIASGPLAGVTEQPYKHSLNQDFLLLQVILQLHCEAGGCGVSPWPFPACIRVTDDPLERLLLSQLHWCTASPHCFPTCWAVGNFFIVLEL